MFLAQIKDAIGEEEASLASEAVLSLPRLKRPYG